MDRIIDESFDYLQYLKQQKEFEVISTYTRAQAIADGVLIDVTETAKKAGFKFPIAVTASVWADIENIPKRAETFQSTFGRLWDLLTMLLFTIRTERKNAGSILYFSLSLMGVSQNYRLKSICGPGDEGEPVITIMKPNED